MSLDLDVLRLARPEIAALAPYASARALAGHDGILLNANESPWPPWQDPGLDLNRYPEPQPAALKTRLAELYGVDPARLLITRGSDEGIDLLVRAFCRPGQDRVLVCPPCFGLYALSARIQGAEVIEAPLVESPDRWRLPVDLAARAAGCKLVFVCSPNNPTGDLLSEEEVGTLARAIDDQGLLVIDEAYVEFAPHASLMHLQRRHPNIVVLRTLSKAHALAGCRIGTVIADPEVIALLRRIIAPYPLPTPTVAAALAALSSEGIAGTQARIAQILEHKQALVQVLRSHPEIRQVWPGTANFVLVRASDGPRLVRDADLAGIRLRDQSAQHGLRDCVRITIGTPLENRRLTDFLQQWKP